MDATTLLILGCTGALVVLIGVIAVRAGTKLNDIHEDVRHTRKEQRQANHELGRQQGRMLHRLHLSLTTFQRWWNVNVLHIKPPDYPPPPPKGSDSYYEDKQ